MVIPAETTPEAPPEPLLPSAAFAPPSHRGSFQSSLHNFDFPVLKTWGRHRVLRCLNVNRKGEIIAGHDRSGLVGASVSLAARIPRNDDSVEDPSFEEVKSKLLIHLREAADRINKVPVPNSRLSASVSVAPPATAVPNSKSSASVSAAPPPAAPEPFPCSQREVTLPWNLRTRNPTNKEPRSSHSPPPSVSEKSGQAKVAHLRSESVEKGEWPKISIPLTRKEIEEDIFALTGLRPHRRPKKRPRILQRQLDLLVPGSWLSSISSDTYRVPDST